MKEQDVIEQYDNLLNDRRAFNSEEYNKEHYKVQKKLYILNNKEKVTEYKRKHYQENKDKISEKRKVKVLCECGCEIRKNHIARHKQSKKHIKLMESNTITK